MRQPTAALGRISCPLRSRGSHLESWCIISVVLVLAVTDPGVWVLLRSTEHRFFSGDVYFRGCNSLYNSGYMLVRQYLGGFGRFSHIFYVAADSNPDSVSSPFGFNGEVCPVDASGCSFAPRSSHLQNWTYFSSSTWLTPVMMVWIFRRIFMAFFGLLFGVEAPVATSCPGWLTQSCRVMVVSKTTTTTTTTLRSQFGSSRGHPWPGLS